MKKLRILVLANRVPWPLNDGGNRASYFPFKYLASKGHQIDLCALNTSKHFVEATDFPWEGKVYLTSINTELSFSKAFLNLFSSLPYNISRFWSEEFNGKLEEVLVSHAYDIVQLEGSYMSLYVPIIRKYSNAKVILRSHNIEHEIWGRVSDENTNILKRVYLRYLGRGISRFELKLVDSYDGIIAITKRDADYYKKSLFNGLIDYIGVGSIPLLEPQKRINKDVVLGFIGSMDWMPNLNGLNWFLKNVWGKLKETYPKLEFRVAGKNMPNDLMNKSKNGLRIVGEVNDPQEFMFGLDILVVPLFSGGGMRVKVVEGMAQECCVVGTPIGVEGVGGEEGKDYLIANSVTEMVNTISGLLENPAKTKLIARNGREYAERHFGWESLVKLQEGFYFRIL